MGRSIGVKYLLGTFNIYMKEMVMEICVMTQGKGVYTIGRGYEELLMSKVLFTAIKALVNRVELTATMLSMKVWEGVRGRADYSE